MKIIVVLSRMPYPLDKGDKLRAYHQIKCLADRHEVYLFALYQGKHDEEALKHLSTFCRQVVAIKHSWMRIAFNMFYGLFSNLPFQVCYFLNRRARKKLEKMCVTLKPDHLYCQLIRTAPLIKNITGIKKTLDYQDAFAKSVERMMNSVPGYLRFVYRTEYQRLRYYENIVFHYFDHHSIISEQDRNHISHTDNGLIEVVPNGVDLSHFTYKLPVKMPYTFLFHGNMSYLPNIDCVEYLVQQVLPVLRDNWSGLTLLISGADPVDRVKSLQGNNITVTGRVPDPVESYRKAAILLAPMRLSTGLQNKLLEAMSCGLPCITSSLANQALLAERNVEILIGDTPEEIRTCVKMLLDDPGFYEELSRRGRKFVEKRYSWEANTEKLIRLMEK